MTFKSKLKHLLNLIKGFIPRTVPQGMTDFNELIDFLIETYNPPMNRRSVRFVVSAMIQRLNPKLSNLYGSIKAPVTYAYELKRGAASQVGMSVLTDIKEEDRAAQQKAAQEQAEATAAQSVADGLPVQQ